VLEMPVRRDVHLMRGLVNVASLPPSGLVKTFNSFLMTGVTNRVAFLSLA
jgi:hypothetical protein